MKTSFLSIGKCLRKDIYASRHRKVAEKHRCSATPGAGFLEQSLARRSVQWLNVLQGETGEVIVMDYDVKEQADREDLKHRSMKSLYMQGIAQGVQD